MGKDLFLRIERLSNYILNSSKNHTERYLAMTGLYTIGKQAPDWVFEIDVTTLVLYGNGYSQESKELAGLLINQITTSPASKPL